MCMAQRHQQIVLIVQHVVLMLQQCTEGGISGHHLILFEAESLPLVGAELEVGEDDLQ